MITLKEQLLAFFNDWIELRVPLENGKVLIITGYVTRNQEFPTQFKQYLNKKVKTIWTNITNEGTVYISIEIGD